MVEGKKRGHMPQTIYQEDHLFQTRGCRVDDQLADEMDGNRGGLRRRRRHTRVDAWHISNEGPHQHRDKPGRLTGWLGRQRRGEQASPNLGCGYAGAAREQSVLQDLDEGSSGRGVPPSAAVRVTI